MESDPIILSNTEIAELCEAGSHAPSGGNAQPWLVHVKKNVFEIRFDAKRSDSFIDVGKYASFFALGCFVQNMHVVAESLGLVHEVTFLGLTHIQEPIVRITFSKRTKPLKDTIYKYIHQRVTNRKLYDGSILAPNLIKSLEDSVAGNSGCKITCYSSYTKKQEIATVLGKADALRALNHDLFIQMMDEFRWSQKETEKTKDGLDLQTLELPANMDKMFMLLKKFPKIRKLLPQSSLEDMAKPLILNCSHICCLSTNEEMSSKTMFIAGRVMEQLWLTITKLSLSLHPWSVSTFIIMRQEIFNGVGFSDEENTKAEEIAHELRKSFNLTKKETPIFIFRLSKAPPPSARSLRLPWQTFTTIEK